MLKAQPPFGFGQQGQPNIPGAGHAPQQYQTGNNNANVDISTLIAQNNMLMQRMAEMSQHIAAGQQQKPELRAPEKPANFDVNDIYDPETPSGKYHQAEQEYRNKLLLGQVTEALDSRLNQFEQKNVFNERLNDLGARKGMTPQQLYEFKSFIDQPNVDMDVLYDVYVTKNKQAYQQPQANQQPQAPPAQQHAPPVNPLDNPHAQPLGVGQVGGNPPPLSSAPAGDTGNQTPTFGQQIANVAKQSGMV